MPGCTQFYPFLHEEFLMDNKQGPLKEHDVAEEFLMRGYTMFALKLHAPPHQCVSLSDLSKGCHALQHN